MNNLKTLTWEHHQNAERQAFVKELLSNEITKERYAQFLYNQYFGYKVLEDAASRVGLFDDMVDAKRAISILQDFEELWPHADKMPTLCPVVDDYLNHIKLIEDEPMKLMAHVYVRHMGDLSGGQLIAKRVPGQGRLYQFIEDTDVLKDHLRSKCSDDMADEAKICFDFATRLFQEMMEYTP